MGWGVGAAEEKKSKAVRNPSPSGWAVLLWAGDQRLGLRRVETGLAQRKKERDLWERERREAEQRENPPGRSGVRGKGRCKEEKGITCNS